MKNQAIILFSGYNIRAVIAFCRWAAAHEVTYHIIAKSTDDPIFYTDYKDQVVFTRDSPSFNPEQFRSWTSSICRQFGHRRVIILPSTEYLNRFLLDHRGAIESRDCIVPLVNEQLYKAISDKQKFKSLCQSHGLDVPEDFSRIPERLPFVAKPRAYFSTTGKQLVPYLIETPHDFTRFSGENPSDFFFQEFVRGQSLYLLAYIGIKGNVLYSQENLMQQGRGGSVILARQCSLHLEKIAEEYVEMLRNMKYVGLIMVEVRLDPSNGKYYMIEANPRPWGPMQFVVDNNVDVFGAMLSDYEFDISRPVASPRPGTYYFWSGGLTWQSSPVTFHSYGCDEFVRDFPSIRPQDMFLRKDTIKLYCKEAGMGEVNHGFSLLD